MKMDKRNMNNRLFWLRKDLSGGSNPTSYVGGCEGRCQAVIAAAGGRAVPGAGRAMTSAVRTCSDGE